MPKLNFDDYLENIGADGKPLSGVGRGVGLRFVQAYFPEGCHTIRIASGFFTINGYDASRIYKKEGVGFRVLVGRKQGTNAVDAVVKEILREILKELGQTRGPLHDAVKDLMALIDRHQFTIASAHESRHSRFFHCKFYIMDDTVMWSGSANFTGSGLKRDGGNAEQAVASRAPKDIANFTQYYDDVSANARDLTKLLYERLKAWLLMASPFEAYLRFLSVYYGLETNTVGKGAHLPAYFQEGIIRRAVAQAKQYDGALLLVATGLGKTVIGAEVARRVTGNSYLWQIIVLAPQTVYDGWKDELSDRGLVYKFFDTGLLFKQGSLERESDPYKVDELLQQLNVCGENTLLLIDEAHRYRKTEQREFELQQLNRRRGPHEEKLINRVKARLRHVAEKKGKIVLLTATPYGTDKQNLDSLLSLLPPTDTHAGHLWEKKGQWQANTLPDMANLPVVSILGIIHLLKLAALRGDAHEDDNRLFIAMPENKISYLPCKMVLHRVPYLPFLEAEVQTAFEQGVFVSKTISVYVYNDDKRKNETTIVDVVRNNALRAWLSSPQEMARFVRQYQAVIGMTAQAIEAFGQELFDFNEEPLPNFASGGATIPLQSSAAQQASKLLSIAEREAILQTLLDKLDAFAPPNDEKLSHLVEIIKTHHTKEEKVIIFVKRYATAVYLDRVLPDRLNDCFFPVRVGCTAVEVAHQKKYTLKKSDLRKKIIRHFSPRSHKARVRHDDFGVLICTDADGIGVNMQDANVVVNYDLPSGADELFQRAGRVLRMTEERNRILHIYTFVPEPQDHITALSSTVEGILQKLADRHDKARDLISGTVLPSNDGSRSQTTEISLATAADIEDLLARSKTLGVNFGEETLQNEPDAVFSHYATLEKYKDVAGRLTSDPIISAKEYDGVEPLIAVLMRYEEVSEEGDATPEATPENLHILLYSINRQKLERKKPETIFDLLRCEKNEAKALVGPDIVELKSLEAIEAWRKQNQKPDGVCSRLCSVYLQPTLPHDEALKEMSGEVIS